LLPPTSVPRAIFHSVHSWPRELAPTGENSPVSMELRDERKVVTALFADLVGSTALGERLDPEELRLVVGDAVARIVAEVAP
jgi:class 3 adenylate cyclase